LEKGSFQNIISPVAGTVDFCNNEKIVIKTDQDTILAVDGLGEGAEANFSTLKRLKRQVWGIRRKEKFC